MDFMKRTGEQIIRRRRERPVSSPDLLNCLIYGKDPATGQSLSDSIIIDQMITFLIAGHEMTSGMLSFVFYYLLKHPRILEKTQQEVDHVVGTEALGVEHLGALPYVTAILRETLRLHPTAGRFDVTLYEETVIDGKCGTKKEQSVGLMVAVIHQAKPIYGEDAEEFRPERMLDEDFNKIPPNSWKPCGNDMKACIGRPFAWQEALLTVTTLIQNLEFEMADPSYELQVKETLTIKPVGFETEAQLRRYQNSTELLSALGAGQCPPSNKRSLPSKLRREAKRRIYSQLTIPYGPNSGNCEAISRHLAKDAASGGFSAENAYNTMHAKW